MGIETVDLEYVYPDGTRALRGVSLKIENKKTAIIGANGSGKTTFLLHLNGILKPTRGEVRLDGVPLKYDRESLQRLRSRVGIVFQHPDDQLFAPTVEQDVAFGPRNLGLPVDLVRERVEEALEIVGLEGKAGKPPHLLSGGEKKRAAIAGILAMQPEVIILDEPTSNLDPEGSEGVIELLEELALQGKTIVISTHDMELAYQWAEKLYLLREGSLIGEGTPHEIFKKPGLLREAKLTPPRILTIYHELLKRQAVPPARTPKNELELIELIAIPSLKQLAPPPKPGEGEYATFTRTREDRQLQVTGIQDTPSPWSGRILERKQGCLVVHLPTPTPQETGKICIYDASEYTREDFQRALLETSYLGVMGTKAKTLARKENLEPDFTSDVINKTLLQAIAGYNCLILTSGGMVEHTRKRIQNYNQQSGLEIKVEIKNTLKK